jgi:monoamine oxidase
LSKPSHFSRRDALKGLSAAALIASAPGRFAQAQGGPPDVLVLGAGLAGLNAALNLEDVGFRVQVLEGNDRVGGRLFTAAENEVPGHPEMGGSGIGSHYARILYVAERFGVEMRDSRPRTEPRKGELMYHLRGQPIAVDEWATHQLNPFSTKSNRGKKLSSFQFLVYPEDENPLPRHNFEAWQSGKYGDVDISVFDYLSRKGLSGEAIKLGCGTNMSYGTSPHDLSMLMGFQSSNLINSLYRGDNALPARSMASAGGNQRIPEAMAGGLGGDVLLNQHVRSIESDGKGVRVTTIEGRVFRAKFCVCTLPFSALRHVHIAPAFEGLQAEAVHQLEYTPVFQAHFVPLKPYWEIDGLPPSMWTDRICGRFMALKNDPSEPERITSCLSFVNGQMARYLDRFAPEKAGRMIESLLAEIRPSTKGALRLAKVYSWNRTPFAGGAYAYWQPGQATRFAKTMREPLARIHFAGEHTAVINRGMEGAMESGERAALEVIDRLS